MQNKNLIINSLFYFLPYVLFFALFLPQFGSLPYLDGNIDFIKTTDFFSGGFKMLFTNWPSAHPPLKPVVLYPFYKMFGINTFSFVLPGLIAGFAGIFAVCGITSGFFNRPTGTIAGLLLAMSPIFVATGVFSLIDYLLAVFILLATFYYLRSKYLLFSIFSILAFFTKETALTFIFSMIIVEIVFGLLSIVRKHAVKQVVVKILFVTAPLIITLLWFGAVKSLGQTPWSDWNFSEVAQKGSLFTIYHNITTLNFLNKYAYQNWSMLFFLNFAWVNWLVLIAGLVVYFIKQGGKTSSLNLHSDSQNTKTFWGIAIFFISYFMGVLSFQTYTVPRYSLPLIPFVLIGVSWALVGLTNEFQKLKGILFVGFFLIIITSFYSSTDPLSTHLWGKTTVLGEDIYALNRTLAGNDGITYNGQYLFILTKRTGQIQNHSAQTINATPDCWWLFPDVRNDAKTLQRLKLNPGLYEACHVDKD